MSIQRETKIHAETNAFDHVWISSGGTGERLTGWLTVNVTDNESVTLFMDAESMGRIGAQLLAESDRMIARAGQFATAGQE